MSALARRPARLARGTQPIDLRRFDPPPDQTPIIQQLVVINVVVAPAPIAPAPIAPTAAAPRDARRALTAYRGSVTQPRPLIAVG